MPQSKDWVGGPRPANTGSYATLNGNPGWLYMKDLAPKKGSAEMWSYKHKSGSKLQKHMGLKGRLHDNARGWSAMSQTLPAQV